MPIFQHPFEGNRGNLYPNSSVIGFEFRLPSAHFPHSLKIAKLINFHWLSLPLPLLGRSAYEH